MLMSRAYLSLLSNSDEEIEIVSKLKKRIRSLHVYRLQQNPGVNMTR